MESSFKTPSSPPDALARIEAKLDRLEHRLARFDALLEQAPGFLALAGDSFDEVAGDVDLDARVRAAVRVLDRLTRPETLAQVERALEIAEGLPGFLAIAGDSLDEFAREQAARGVDVELVMRNFGKSFDAILRLIGSAQIQQLLESDLLLPGAIESLGEAARAMANAHAATPTRLGFFGMLRELRDPDVQRALGFAVDVARRVGNQLEHPRALNPSRT